MEPSPRVEWWLVVVGDTLNWARLTEFDNGHAHVPAADGEVRQFVDVASAHADLLDADFRAFDGLDEDDAEALGLELDSIMPPDADDEEELPPLMSQRVRGAHFR